MTPEEVSYLVWVYVRLVTIHGENASVDYMVKLKQIIEKYKVK